MGCKTKLLGGISFYNPFSQFFGQNGKRAKLMNLLLKKCQSCRVLIRWSWINLGQMHCFSRFGHRGHWQVAHKPLFMCHLSVSPEPEMEKLCICPKLIQLHLLRTLQSWHDFAFFLPPKSNQLKFTAINVNWSTVENSFVKCFYRPLVLCDK